MGEAESAEHPGQACVLAVPVGRNEWVRREATLHFLADRLVKAEGIDLPQRGPLGLTGTLYVVRESLHRENRLVMRVERQKLVDGKVVARQNWGEIEDALPPAACVA